MAALIAGSLAAAGGAYAASQSAPGSPNLPKYNPRQATFLPLLFSFLQSGGNIDDLLVRKVLKGGGGGGGGKKGLGKYTIDNAYGLGGGGSSTGKYKQGWYLPDGTKVTKANTIKFGNQRVLVTGDLARSTFQKQFDTAQEEALGQTQKNFDLIFGDKGPQFLKDRISNRPQQIRDAFGPAVSKGIRQAIGGAAPGGTLTTDAVLQRVSAPLAFQAETLFQQAEDARNAQELGLSGVPGYGSGFGSNPNNFLQPQSLDALQGLGLQAFTQGQFGPAYANYQGRASSQGYKSGLYAGAGGQIAGLFGQQAGG